MILARKDATYRPVAQITADRTRAERRALPSGLWRASTIRASRTGAMNSGCWHGVPALAGRTSCRLKAGLLAISRSWKAPCSSRTCLLAMNLKIANAWKSTMRFSGSWKGQTQRTHARERLPCGERRLSLDFRLLDPRAAGEAVDADTVVSVLRVANGRLPVIVVDHLPGGVAIKE